ncbi:hypothetical protein A3SI_03548 [Nitritalea halalkaliphila LW7]|uniref:Uncharacterized protein n=1 Tax=Nitritalea halalkaliphila LW7 TaxID=1189621 RepID=I5C9C6_9BACT|nr:hypothetical protein [Nitritalea halalkaliphila]EIM78428.1 hypothetical protein A3SI_03548 [Nitritalea halalkaliphila LW7]
MRIEADFEKQCTTLFAAAVRRGEGIAMFTDCFCGDILRVGDPYAFLHVFSPEEIFEIHKDTLTDEEISSLVNCPENVRVTRKMLRDWKGTKNPKVWLQEMLDSRAGNIDPGLTRETIAKAEKGIRFQLRQLSPGGRLLNLFQHFSLFKGKK